jgi:multiple sugar transport system substrate-binding protein
MRLYVPNPTLKENTQKETTSMRKNMRPSPRRRKSLAVGAVCASGLLLLAACGSSSSKNSGGSTGSSGSSTTAGASGTSGTSGGGSSGTSGSGSMGDSGLGTFTQAYKGKTLTVLDGAPTGATAKQTQEYYNLLAADFKKVTGATVKWQYYSSPQQEVSTIETSTVSGSGPDVLSYGTSFVGTLWQTGDFQAFSSSDWNAVGGKSSYIPADLFDSGLTSANDIGIPNETNPFVLAYNKAYFKKAGITSAPKTWSELVSDGQKVQSANPGVGGVGMDPEDSYDPWKNVYFIAVQDGSPGYVSADSKQILLDSPQVEKAAQFYFSLESQYHVVPKAALTWNSAEMDSAFEQGKVGMILLSAYGLPVSGTKLQGNLGYAPLPTIPYGMSQLPAGGKAIETETTGNFWAIPKYVGSLRPLALEFDKISASVPVQLEQFKLLGWMPVTYAGVKAVEKDDPTSKPFIQAEEGAIATSKIAAWSYVETGMETALNNMSSQLARTGSLSTSYIDSQLTTATQAAQAHLSS